MSLTLPPVGTNRLLDLLSPYAPDDFIAEICPRDFTGGRRHDLSAAQLWRTPLLRGVDFHAFAQSRGGAIARTGRVAAFCPVAAHAAHGPDAP